MLSPKYASRAAALSQRIQNSRLPLVRQALTLELEGLHNASREERFGAPPVARMPSRSSMFTRPSPVTMQVLPAMPGGFTSAKVTQAKRTGLSAGAVQAIITPEMYQSNQVTRGYIRAADQRLSNKAAAGSRANVLDALQKRLDQLVEQRRQLGTFPMMYRAAENQALEQKLADIRSRMIRVRSGQIRDLMTEYRIIEQALLSASSSVGGLRRVYDTHRGGRGMLTNKGVLLPDIPSSGTAPEMIELTDAQPETEETTDVAPVEESWLSRNRTPLLIGGAAALAIGVYALRRRK